MRKQIFKVAVIILLVSALTGYIVPAVFLNDGTERYQGVEREYAKDALYDTESQLSTPSFYKVYITKLKVVELKQTNNNRCKYQAIVQAHTYFGIPLKSAKLLVLPGCSIRTYTE